jgi:hypothetical protein
VEERHDRLIAKGMKMRDIIATIFGNALQML